MNQVPFSSGSTFWTWIGCCYFPRSLLAFKNFVPRLSLGLALSEASEGLWASAGLGLIAWPRAYRRDCSHSSWRRLSGPAPGAEWRHAAPSFHVFAEMCFWPNRIARVLFHSHLSRKDAKFYWLLVSQAVTCLWLLEHVGTAMVLLYVLLNKTACFFENTKQAFWSSHTIKMVFLLDFYNWAITLIHMLQG